MIKRGVLKSWSSSAYTCSVQLAGSLTSYLESVPVTRGLEDADMVAGRNVAVLFTEPGNKASAVVIAVWT